MPKTCSVVFQFKIQPLFYIAWKYHEVRHSFMLSYSILSQSICFLYRQYCKTIESQGLKKCYSHFILYQILDVRFISKRVVSFKSEKRAKFNILYHSHTKRESIINNNILYCICTWKPCVKCPLQHRLIDRVVSAVEILSEKGVIFETKMFSILKDRQYKIIPLQDLSREKQ